MKIRPNELRTPKAVTRVASDLGQRMKKTGAQIRDRFERSQDTMRSRLTRARALVKPAFRDMFEGVRRRDHGQVLRGAHDLASRLGLVFAPPRNATTPQVLTNLGQTVLGRDFRYTNISSIRNLEVASVNLCAKEKTVAKTINDPDTSLRKPGSRFG